MLPTLMHIHRTFPVQNIRNAYGHLAYRHYRFILIHHFPKKPKPGVIYLSAINKSGDIEYQTYLEMYKQVSQNETLHIFPSGVYKGSLNTSIIREAPCLSNKQKKLWIKKSVLLKNSITDLQIQEVILTIAHHNHYIMGGPRTINSQLKAVLSLFINIFIFLPLLIITCLLIDVLLLSYKLGIMSIEFIKNIGSIKLSFIAHPNAINPKKIIAAHPLDNGQDNLQNNLQRVLPMALSAEFSGGAPNKDPQSYFISEPHYLTAKNKKIKPRKKIT